MESKTVSKTVLVIRALLARGYCEASRLPPDLAAFRCFAISPKHARRIEGRYQDSTNRVWLSVASGRWRHGITWDMGRPLPRATMIALQREGQALEKKRAKAKMMTLEDIA